MDTKIDSIRRDFSLFFLNGFDEGQEFDLNTFKTYLTDISNKMNKFYTNNSSIDFDKFMNKETETTSLENMSYKDFEIISNDISELSRITFTS